MTSTEQFLGDGFDKTAAMFGPRLKRIVAFYIEDAANYGKTIGEAAATGDCAALVGAAHPLKSASRQLGADKVATLAYALECQGKAGVMERDITSQVNELNAIIAGTCRALMSKI